MFRLTSPQSSLFEPDTIFPGILPFNDWSYIFREKIYPLIDESKFKHLFAEEGGAPNKSVKTIISLIIFMGIEVLNWRQAEYQFLRRVDWLIATNTAFGDGSIDHTTLFKFYQRLEKDDTAYGLFKDLTTRFISECHVSTRKQRTDSFFMHGWLEVLSRYGLFKETNRVFLQNLRKQKPDLYENIKSELSRDYLEKHFDLTEKDKEKAKKQITEMAQDLYRLKEAFGDHNEVKHYESFKTLSKVFDQQCCEKETSSPDIKEEVIGDDSNIVRGNISEQKETEDAKVGAGIKKEEEPVRQEIEIRKNPEGEQIISTPHNTDAQYTRKGKQRVVGHKVFVTETCDSGNEVQFITDINLENAGHSDAKEISKIEDRLDDNGLKPGVLYGDAGFVNGKSIIESEVKGIDLAGPSSGRSQSIEDFAKKDRPLDIADFNVEIIGDLKELQVLSCPNGQKPLDQKRSDKTGQKLVHFDQKTCSQCDLNERCPVKICVNTATLTVTEEQYAGAARHHKYMSDTNYRKECGIRAGAESLVNEIANGHGARQAKHRSKKRSKLQAIFATIGCNVKRYLGYMVNYVPDNRIIAANVV